MMLLPMLPPLRPVVGAVQLTVMVLPSDVATTLAGAAGTSLPTYSEAMANIPSPASLLKVTL